MLTNKDIITDANNLYDAYLKSRIDSSWKPQVKEYRNIYILQISDLQYKLINNKYKSSKGKDFQIHERGKIRFIRSNSFYDRVIRRCFSDNVLVPSLRPHLIHDNGASLKGKGLSFTRRRFEQHLHEAFREYGSNDFVVILIDLSKYYDNIDHDQLKSEVFHYITDLFSQNLYSEILSNFEVDVSYLPDNVFKNYKYIKFDLNNWFLIYRTEHCKIKMMKKSCAVGDQCSQISGVFHGNSVDQYFKSHLHIKYYDKHMDDTAILINNKLYAKHLINIADEKYNDIYCFLNRKKTKICKVNKYFKWLQFNYKVTSTGHIIIKINKTRIVSERRRLKKYKNLYNNGSMSLFDIQNSYKSWMGSFHKYMSKYQRIRMDILFLNLFGKEIYGKKDNSNV